MNRRTFLAAAAASAAGLEASDTKRQLLLPSDEPDELGFRLMWYSPVPAIDISRYQLRVHGLVEKPQEFSLAGLNRFPQESQTSRLKCVQCWSARTTWAGFRFGHLVEVVKPLRAAKAVRFDCADKWYEYFSLQDLASPRVLLALSVAGHPLPDRHGAPLRLIDPGRYGYKSAKLITSIEFVVEGKGSMACDIGPYYSPGGEIKAGYDHPLDLGPNERRKIPGGEITGY
jgi:DMSO/TMAO reductase YedYZ molybdopterin-dependent catalytic subunit